jgi:CDP-paratose 2-epimerase
MSCIYGTRQFGNEDQGWVAHFLIAAALGLPLTIYGNGKQVRDLLFVDDLVRAFHHASEHIDQTAGRVYNIGGGHANSISIWRELSPKLEALSGTSLSPTWDAWRPGDQPIYVSNTAKARQDFGWSPTVSVDQGIERLWTWIQDHRPILEAALAPHAPVNGKVRGDRGELVEKCGERAEALEAAVAVSDAA